MPVSACARADSRVTSEERIGAARWAAHLKVRVDTRERLH